MGNGGQTGEERRMLNFPAPAHPASSCPLLQNIPRCPKHSPSRSILSGWTLALHPHATVGVEARRRINRDRKTLEHHRERENPQLDPTERSPRHNTPEDYDPRLTRS